MKNPRTIHLTTIDSEAKARMARQAQIDAATTAPLAIFLLMALAGAAYVLFLRRDIVAAALGL